MSMEAAARDLVADLGMIDRVIFNDGWVPYEERGWWLLESDIGVSAHFDSVESRFAFRTRLLDYLWAGLPVVTTRGDSLGDTVEQHGLGYTLAAGDVEGWVAALSALLDDPGAVEQMRENAKAACSELAWSTVALRLATLLDVQGQRVSVEPHVRLARIRELALKSGLSLEHRGRRGAARHLAATVKGATRSGATADADRGTPSDRR
jgi:hypothetical protein